MEGGPSDGSVHLPIFGGFLATPLDNLWQFNYKKGSAFCSAIVRARNETFALDVARAWCASQAARPPARVFPMIVADESILDSAMLADPVAAR